jgi:tetratricopeptide (TPR) repeat protein
MRIGAFAAALVTFLLNALPNAVAHDGEGLGTVDFRVSCTPEAQQRFNRAAALLHSFDWRRVEPALADVLQADQGCAMAYWALAVAKIDNALGSPPTPKQQAEGWAAVQKAKEIGGKTERERDYIGSVETFYKDHDKVPFARRAAEYEKALAQLHARYPDDIEAAVLYAFWLQVMADRNDQTYSNQLKSARILEKVFAAHPDHPGAAHFLIHAYDFPAIAHHGVDAAKRYSQIAPAAPHALHMPSHIFSRIGLWQDSIDSNTRSRDVAKLHRDVYHGLDYMVYAALQLGRDEMAKQWLDLVAQIHKPNEEARQIAYAGAAIPARYALERGEWRAAAQAPLYPARESFAWQRFPEGEAVNAYARGLGAARSGNASGARTEIARLGALREAMVAQKKDYWVVQADIQMGAIAAWAARAEGRSEEALKLMREAADREDRTEKHIMMPGPILPVREMLGELLLELKEPALALAAFEQSQKSDPNRFRNVYGAGRAAELAGDREKARKYYAQLLQQVGDQAGNRAELQRARAFTTASR